MPLASERWWSPDTVCIITGGNKGIGAAAAQLLAEQGLRVVLGCRSEERGREAVAKLQAHLAGREGAGSVEFRWGGRRGVRRLRGRGWLCVCAQPRARRALACFRSAAAVAQPPKGPPAQLSAWPPAADVGRRCRQLDISDRDSVQRFAESFGPGEVTM